MFNILVIDIGGTHVKALASGQDPFRQFDSGPSLTPEAMVSNVLQLACDWKYEAVSVGYPGTVRQGRPVSEPCNLGKGWVGFDYETAFRLPVKLVNDAAMQALGSFRGGKMLFLGFGTGLGSAMIMDGVVEPMELGHLPYKRATFEDYVGIRGLKQHGEIKWRQYVTDVVKRLVAALEPDDVVLGGGNIHKLDKLPDGCRAGSNSNAFQGGFRLWDQPVKNDSPTPLTVKLGLLLALLLWTSAGFAQETLSLDTAAARAKFNFLAGTNTNSVNPIFSCLGEETQTSCNLPPFQLLLPRDHLLGNWGGLRTKFEERGIVPTVTYVADLAGNPTGGRSQGFAYSDNIGLDLFFDLEKLAGLEGSSLLVSMSQRDGDSLSSKRVGNVFTIQQNYGSQTFHLIDVAYLQKLMDDRIEVRLGRIATGDDFLVSPYNYLFMQNGFDGNPVGIFFNSPGMSAYPNSTWGAVIRVRPSERAYVMAGVYNGDPSIRNTRHNGAQMSMNGPLFLISEVGYQINGLTGDSPRLGNYKAGFWHDNSPYTDFNSIRAGHLSSSKRGNCGLYAMFDQVLFPIGDQNSNRGFGVFGTFMASPNDSVSRMPYFLAGGAAVRGMFAPRPLDVAAIGVVYGVFSGDLRREQELMQLRDPTVEPQNYETVMELTYRFSFRNGALFFQPDAQYIFSPGGASNIRDAFVLGCQIGLNF